jgi:putative ABC transport system substrate-binding protein
MKNLHYLFEFERGVIMKAKTLLLSCVFLLSLSGCGKKAQEEKVYRVGIISGAPPFESIADGFKAKMTELGYIEGKNIIYDFQKENIDPEMFWQAAKKFVQDKVDLIVTFPTEPSVVAKAATQGTGIPVVFAMAGIENKELIENIRQPGGNATGVRYPAPENTGAWLEILLELVPQAKRVYVVYDPDYPNVYAALPTLRSTASTLGVTLVEDPIYTRDLKGLQAALDKRSALDDIGVDAMMMMPDILTHSPEGFGALIKFANEHKLPFGGGMDFTADLGAMFSYVADNIDQGRLAADIADKILKGTPASTIPVVTPEARLRLNYKVIQELGLKVNEGLLSRADEIIR